MAEPEPAPVLTAQEAAVAVAEAVPNFDDVADVGEVAVAPVVATEVTEGETLQQDIVPEPEAQPGAAAAEGKTVMVDMIETTKNFTEDAKAKFATAFSEIKEKAKVGVEKSSKAVEELTEITKGNVEAFVESGKIAAKGVETLGQEAADFGRKSFETATANMKSLAAVKSPTEFFQLQSELLSTVFDSFAKETAKNSEAMLKLAGDIAQPISSRVSVVTEKVKSLAA